MSEKYPPAPQCSWTDYYLKYKKKQKKNELDKELLIEKKIKKNLFTRNITCTFTNFHCIYKYL